MTGIFIGIRLAVDLVRIIFAFRMASDFVESVEYAEVFASIIKDVESIIEDIGYVVLIATIVFYLTKAWTKIGMMLLVKTASIRELEADEFTFNLGYGNELCTFLESNSSFHMKGLFATGCGDELCMLLESNRSFRVKGLFASLANAHLDKDDRIKKFQELGVTYRA